MITQFKIFESNPHRFEIGDYVKYRNKDQFGRISYSKNKDRSTKIYKLLDIKTETYGKIYSLLNIKTNDIAKLVNVGKQLDKISDTERLEIDAEKYNL